MSEQRRNFIRDYVAGFYSRVELAQVFSISRKTADNWIGRFKQNGDDGLEERSRRPHSCPWQTDAAVAQEIIRLRKARPRRPAESQVHALADETITSVWHYRGAAH